MSETETPVAAAEEKVAVNAAALRQILEAINGPEHILREMKVLRGSSISQLTGHRSPIDIVIEDFNAAIDQRNAASSKPDDAEVIAAPAPDVSVEEAPRVMPPMPTKQSEIGYKSLPFFFDAMDRTRPEDFEGTYANVGLAFNTLSLLPLLDRSPDLLEQADRQSLQGYFDEHLEVTAVVARVETDVGFKLLTLDIPNGKRIPLASDPGNHAFNVTMKYKGRLFTLESFMSWAPDTGSVNAVSAGLSYDMSMQRLAHQLGIDGIVKEIVPHCYHVRGRFHQQFA